MWQILIVIKNFFFREGEVYSNCLQYFLIYPRVVSGLFGHLSYLLLSPVSSFHVHFQMNSFPFFEVMLRNFSRYNWRHIIYFTTSQFPEYDRRQLVRKGHCTINNKALHRFLRILPRIPWKSHTWY